MERTSRNASVIAMNNLELFKDLFYVDKTSPSFLKWKISITNRVKANDVAGCLTSHGYWRVTYKGKQYPVHLIVYVLTFNEYKASMTIDHIDNCPSNNNPNNLKWATKSEQNFNRRKWGFKTMNNSLNTFELTKVN